MKRLGELFGLIMLIPVMLPFIIMAWILET